MRRLFSCAAALLLLTPAAAAARVTVAPGCDLVLAHPGGSAVEVRYEEVPGLYDLWEAPGGAVDVFAAGGVTYPSGRYTAVWDDGAEESFTLDCGAAEDGAAEDGAAEGAVNEEAVDEEAVDAGWPGRPGAPVPL